MGKRKNGDGTITYVESKSLYLGRLQIGFKKDGKPNRKTFYGKSEQDVLTKMRKVSYDVGVGNYIKPEDVTVFGWLKTYIETSKYRLKPKTYQFYDMFISYHIFPNRIGNQKLQNVTLMMLQSFINEKSASGLAPATVKKMHTILSAAFEYAVKNEILRKNVCKGVILPRLDKQKVSALSKEESKQFLQAAGGKKLHDFFLLAHDTGLRLGEITALEWRDIDLTLNTVTVSKNVVSVKEDGKYKLLLQKTPKTSSSNRVVPLTERCIKMLKARKSNATSLLVFYTKNHTYHWPSDVSESFHKICKIANITGINVHSLRHTFCTRLLEASVNPKVVQELAGHEDISTTLRTYSHVEMTMKYDAIYHLQEIL